MKKSIVASAVLIGVLGLSGGYLYSATASNQTLGINKTINPVKVESQKLDKMPTVTDINNQDELFKALYQAVNPSHLTQDERTTYELALKNEMKVARLGDQLEAYSYKGIKEYTNQGEARFIVMFAHADAASAGGLPDGDFVDLFVFKKLNDHYVLLARTAKDGLFNSTGGAKSVENVVVDHIKNADPIALGKSEIGYVINFLYPRSGGERTTLNILWLNEKSGIIEDIATKVDDVMYSDIHSEDGYDSFYTLNSDSSHHQLYDLNLYTTGKISDKGGKLVSNDKHRVYQFDGKIYKLAATSKNQYSSSINYESYTKLYSSMNQDGYAPIPYGSLASAFDNQIDYWFGAGIRFFKPIEKNKEYFTWKVQGVKLYGLNVIGIQRGVCDVSGDDRCGEAAYSTIIFEQPLETVQAKLLEVKGQDYTKSSEERHAIIDAELRKLTGESYRDTPKDQQTPFPTLEQINFEGKRRALLVLPLNDEDEGVAEETW